LATDQASGQSDSCFGYGPKLDWRGVVSPEASERSQK